MKKIIKPTFIVNSSKVIGNIVAIKEKISASNGQICFRPHFKTHQSSHVGQWFRSMGIDSITVSSLDMADYFVQEGWSDITVAILVNPLQISHINALAKKITLSLLVDSISMVRFLEKQLKFPVNIWIKIDTGYQRTGIEWDRKDEIISIAKTIKEVPNLSLVGLLTHSGHSYHADTVDDIRAVFSDTVAKMQQIKEALSENGVDKIKISLGDTPTCSAMDNYDGVDEIRCGNFAYYDVQHLMMDVISEERIATVLACPVVGTYPQRDELVVYGGAVHLSKDTAMDKEGRDIYGLVALPSDTPGEWGPTLEETYVKSVSQEHGIIKTTSRILEKIKIGDILMLLPAHSCLTANLMKDNTIYY